MVCRRLPYYALGMVGFVSAELCFAELCADLQGSCPWCLCNCALRALFGVVCSAGLSFGYACLERMSTGLGAVDVSAATANARGGLQALPPCVLLATVSRGSSHHRAALQLLPLFLQSTSLRSAGIEWVNNTCHSCWWWPMVVAVVCRVGAVGGDLCPVS
jgi:hypothetical protein